MSVSVPLYNEAGVKTGDSGLDQILAVKSASHDQMFSVYLRVIRNNIRSFSACTKTRGEVTCSNKKPWKQKGTGRARVGAASSPLWRKGGVLFGPRPGGKQLCVNRSLSRQVMSGLMFDLFQNNKVFCVDLKEDSFVVSTSNAVKILRAMFGNEFLDKKILLLLNDQALNVARSFRILKNVVIELYGRQDIRNLATADVVIFLKDDKETFEDLVVS